MTLPRYYYSRFFGSLGVPAVSLPFRTRGPEETLMAKNETYYDALWTL
jgi:hypothetical protein